MKVPYSHRRLPKWSYIHGDDWSNESLPELPYFEGRRRLTSVPQAVPLHAALLVHAPRAHWQNWSLVGPKPLLVCKFKTTFWFLLILDWNPIIKHWDFVFKRIGQRGRQMDLAHNFPTIRHLHSFIATCCCSKSIPPESIVVKPIKASVVRICHSLPQLGYRLQLWRWLVRLKMIGGWKMRFSKLRASLQPLRCPSKARLGPVGDWILMAIRSTVLGSTFLVQTDPIAPYCSRIYWYLQSCPTKLVSKVWKTDHRSHFLLKDGCFNSHWSMVIRSSPLVLRCSQEPTPASSKSFLMTSPAWRLKNARNSRLWMWKRMDCFLMKSNHMSNPTIIIASHLILSLLLERF